MADSHDTRIASAIPQHTRRALVAGLAMVPLAGVPAMGATDGPILSAISEVKRLDELYIKLYDALENAEWEAAKTHGRRPWSLIAWRSYSAIGGCEIERARDEFLKRPDADPAKIEVEYQDAKRRERAAERAEREWDERSGLTEQRRELESIKDRCCSIHDYLAATTPSTPADAAALLDFVLEEMEIGPADWHSDAITMVASALKSWASS